VVYYLSKVSSTIKNNFFGCKQIHILNLKQKNLKLFKNRRSFYYKLNFVICIDSKSEDFAQRGMGASKLAGIPLGSAYGTWGNATTGSGAGDNPGQLGENIRIIKIPSGAVRTTSTAISPSNIGGCN
jgi:hypothetical protein